jgi:hypothetical protein
MPAWFNQEKKNKAFQIVQHATGLTYNIQYLGIINFAANASAVSQNTACFTGVIFTFHISAMDGNLGPELLHHEFPFITSYIEMKSNGFTGSTNRIALNMAWDIKAGTPAQADAQRRDPRAQTRQDQWGYPVQDLDGNLPEQDGNLLRQAVQVTDRPANTGPVRSVLLSQ